MVRGREGGRKRRTLDDHLEMYPGCLVSASPYGVFNKLQIS